MKPELYDAARARIEASGFTPEIQTRIALFLGAAKACNLPWLALAGSGPADNLAWQAMTSQLFRETEAMTLLARVTQWAPDPMLYWGNAQLTAPLIVQEPVGFDRVAFEALALGHALLATVRLLPLLPTDERALEPFPMALARIEQENGRLVQTQIRLIKDGFPEVPVSEREEVLDRRASLVRDVFERFLVSLGGQ